MKFNNQSKNFSLFSALFGLLFLVACQTSPETAKQSDMSTTEQNTEATAAKAEQQKQFLTTLSAGLSKPPRTPMLHKPDEYDMAYEEVVLTTADSVKLNAWFIPAKSNKIVICNHFSPANRAGFPGHQEPFTFAGGFEVNFLPKYKALHDAGYNVLAYDMRCHGQSETGKEGVSGVGYFEWQDVLASLDYVKNRKETANMDVSLQSMCMGTNATLLAMQKQPEAFENIKSWIAIQPLNGKTYLERVFERMGVNEAQGIAAFEKIYNDMTGLHVNDHDMRGQMGGVKIPTLMVQVRNDMNSRASDIQEMYDKINIADKNIIWIEDTEWRFKGYQYFSDHPEEMIAWYDGHQ